MLSNVALKCHLRHCMLVREKLTAAREEFRSNAEELDRATRRAAAASEEVRSAQHERDVDRDARMRVETELARQVLT